MSRKELVQFRIQTLSANYLQKRVGSVVIFLCKTITKWVNAKRIAVPEGQ